MKRPNEQRKLALIREELREGATQWVLPTKDDPELLEDLFIVLFNPTECAPAPIPTGTNDPEHPRTLRRKPDQMSPSRAADPWKRENVWNNDGYTATLIEPDRCLSMASC